LPSSTSLSALTRPLLRPARSYSLSLTYVCIYVHSHTHRARERERERERERDAHTHRHTHTHSWRLWYWMLPTRACLLVYVWVPACMHETFGALRWRRINARVSTRASFTVH